MSLWQALLANLALAALVMLALDYALGLTTRWNATLGSCAKGGLLGLGAIGMMVVLPTLVGGALLDLRSIFVAASSFVFGPLAGLVSTAIAVLARLVLGGETANVGVGNIVMAALAGMAARRFSAGQIAPRWALLIFALAVTATNLATYFLLPLNMAVALLERTGPAYLSLSFLGALFIGSSIRAMEGRRALETSNMIYRKMVEQLPDALNFKDAKGRFVVANPATARLVGVEEVSDLIGKTDFDFHPEDLAQRYRADEVSLLGSREATRLEQPALLENGRPGWLATLKAPLIDDQGRVAGLITHNRDITEERANAEVKNEFLSVVSHELRTPLTSIKGSLGLLSSERFGPIDPKAANLLQIAQVNSDRLLRLVNDLLDMETIDRGKLKVVIQPTRLEDAVRQAVAEVKGYLVEKGVTITVENTCKGAVVAVDPDRFQQVLGNLLSNAMKFSPAQSVVTIRLADLDGTARMSVVDHGPGIPKDFQSRLFKKFEQAASGPKRKSGGTGLGLSITKSIVEAMNGRITFETADGQGTTFHVDLPLYDALAAKRGRTQATAA
ncbi:PAS domain S-box-containing protein [Fulvimarina manganoxydans]|uniref:histidine kinase n=2 Tax=Fulvimarina manganoxydans TaxID=937218 RepID=A0A1W2ER29_9HYPH|nr:PAS domain S-box-containing protein [Fulvimarina manganoxydans]